MAEYKLVPYHPTPEMVVAAEEAHMPFGDMDMALRMAILAAPEQNEELRQALSRLTQAVRESRPALIDQLAEALRNCIELIELISPIEGDEVRKARAALSAHRESQP